jgi:hypothetical protein
MKPTQNVRTDKITKCQFGWNCPPNLSHHCASCGYASEFGCTADGKKYGPLIRVQNVIQEKMARIAPTTKELANRITGGVPMLGKTRLKRGRR